MPSYSAGFAFTSSSPFAIGPWTGSMTGCFTLPKPPANSVVGKAHFVESAPLQSMARGSVRVAPALRKIRCSAGLRTNRFVSTTSHASVGLD